MAESSHFDIAIIGSGSGNSLLTPEWNTQRVAVVEGDKFGGTCLNVGCIPTKMYSYIADMVGHVAATPRFGVDTTVNGVRWTDMQDRIFGRTDPISDSGLRYRQALDNVSVFPGWAEFAGPRELALSTGQRITAEQIVIAAGAAPMVPTSLLQRGIPSHTSDTIMRIGAQPRHLIIVGGGYIAAEFAHIFGTLGTQISIVTRGQTMLTAMDQAISEAFTALAKSKWTLYPSRTVTQARGSAGYVELTLSDGSTLEADAVLVAVGRKPQTARLKLSSAGVGIHTDGRVVVDAYGRTSTPGVWALGDACSPHQLKHVANHEARCIAHNLLHPDALRAFNHQHVPAAVFTRPQIATVGLTQRRAEESGRSIRIAVQRYADIAYGWASGDEAGFCKLVADDETGRLLGAHIMGEHAAALIQPLVQGMALGASVSEMARGQYWIHPAPTELVENALLQLDEACVRAG